jgi:hypothetical protein
MRPEFSRLEELFVDWNYLLDSRWADYFRALNDTGSLPELIFSGEVDSGLDAFAAFFPRSVNLSRTETANTAVAIVNFDRSDDIESYLAEEVSLDEVSEALNLDRGVDTPIAALYAGYGELITFLDCFRETQAHFPGEESATEIVRRIAQLLRWRFHFIEQQSELHEKFLDRYLDVLRVQDVEARNQFRQYVGDLADFWHGQQGPTLALAGAS